MLGVPSAARRLVNRGGAIMFTHFLIFPARYWLFLLSFIALVPVSHALSFEEALRLAQARAPQVRAAEDRLAAARAVEKAAAALPDPKLVLGLDNVPVDGPDAYSLSRDFMTMRRIALMQDVPNQAKREARVAAARGQVAVAELEAEVARLTVLREAAVAWIARHTVERQLARIDALSEENRLFEAAVRARVAAGSAAPTEVVAPRQEAALIAERRDELLARRSQAIAALRRWIGPAADEPLTGPAPDWPLAPELLMHRLHRHPELRVFDARSRVMDAEVAAAQAEKRPDWSLELAYQQRGPQFSNMASVQLRFDLPLFPGARQDPRIAARQAERAALDAERDAVFREHRAALEADLADYLRLSQALRRQREVLLPLAEEKVALALAAWRGNRASLADLIAARRERIEAELRAIALEGERLQLAARLRYAYAEDTGEQK
ncbi:MAG: TolC family protein [Burkholderiales bacterium]|nr:TolC family protein [Burkholderiales bacterium]